MKILIILAILAILVFLVFFCFAACVVAHDADQHLEKMHEVIFNSNKEEKKKMKITEEEIEDFCRSLPDPPDLEKTTEALIKAMEAVQKHFYPQSVKIREILDFLDNLE